MHLPLGSWSERGGARRAPTKRVVVIHTRIRDNSLLAKKLWHSGTQMHYPNKFLSLGGVGQIGNTGRWSGAGCTSSGGTPTNPTPPDSITEEVYGAAGASGALQSHLYFFHKFSYVNVKIYSGHLPVTVTFLQA